MKCERDYNELVFQKEDLVSPGDAEIDDELKCYGIHCVGKCVSGIKQKYDAFMCDIRSRSGKNQLPMHHTELDADGGMIEMGEIPAYVRESPPPSDVLILFMDMRKTEVGLRKKMLDKWSNVRQKLTAL